MSETNDPHIAAALAAADLLTLAGVYADLYGELTPTRGGDGTSAGSGFKGRPPLEVHVLDVIGKVEAHSLWTGEYVSTTVGLRFTRFRLWWNGDPNPLVAETLVEASQHLPRLAEREADGTLWVAAETGRILASVRGVLGQLDLGRLAGDCPEGCGPTLVRMAQRTACAVCEYSYFDARRST